MSLKVKVIRSIGLFVILFLVFSNVVLSQEIQEAIDAGKVEYIRSCAFCHGDSGKGDGFYASKLIVKPANITLLKKQNKGVFPTRVVFQIIEGTDDIELHGLKSMPIWGDRFDNESYLYVDDRFTRTFVRGRIFELLLYLEEMQAQ
ncbi:MAG: cytochrome c [Gammaproteobacteria bacterium]